MLAKLSVVCFLVSMLFANKSFSAHLDIEILVYEEHFPAIQKLLDDYPNCYLAPLLKQPNIHLMELVLMCQALHLGKLEFSLTPISTPTQLRAVRSLKNGNYPIFANSIWRYLSDNNVFTSTALVKRNGYKKGVYTSVSNNRALNARSITDLQSLSAVVGRTWYLDRAVLDCFGLKQEYVQNYEQMIKMVDANRVDYILHTFGATPDAKIEEFGKSLYPVKNIKFSLPDSLHFFVSRSHPLGKKIFHALSQGIAELESLNKVKEAYTSVGFYNPTIENWTEYSCDHVKKI